MVDDCPSAPGGCFDPGRFTRTPVDPRVVADPAVNPNIRGVPRVPGFGQSEMEDDGGFVPYEEDFYHTEEEIEAAVAEAYSEIEVPDQGYFDYDDSWFDAED